MGSVVNFPKRRHVRASAERRRSAGICIRARRSNVISMPADGAAATTKSQYSTGMEPLRFCSLAVDGALPITRPNAAFPPKASINSATVSGAMVRKSDIETNIYRISVDDVNRTSVDSPCEVPYMGDVGDRLRQARKRAKFGSAAEAARKLGMPTSTYASHENGQTEPGNDDVRRYAKAFRASPAWILTGDGPADAQNLIPLMGRIGAGGDIDPDYEQVPEGGIEEIELLINVGVDAIAFEVNGASMKPRYDSGSLIVCTRNGRDPESLLGIEVALRTVNNKRYLKTLRASRRRGLYILESFNADPIYDVRVAWVGEILAVIPAHRRAAFLSTQARAAG